MPKGPSQRSFHLAAAAEIKAGDVKLNPLLQPLIARGRLVRPLPPPRTVREHVLDQLRRVELTVDPGRDPRRDY